ncbi:PDZ domain-containing protein [Cryobacterium frigoriphilum]|uniref:endopeptidase La n=1 Tax=Cryobacterium frigoriphilum TaxID=1259150 RepID=A0A4R9A1V0_9MICO|nr:S16 family serine protease [Cryobacterium frigoriphilum]TFD50560.1 PDZ domain-containing protein [Cryobacterium frigoriphilum]
MALFSDYPTASPRRPRRSGTTGWVILGVALVAGVILGLTPSPYVIERPGPVYNTLGTVPSADSDDGDPDGETELITIPGETVYATEGSLDLLTVSVVGNRENRPSWLAVARAWLDPSEAVLPLDDVYPADVTTEQREEQNATAMVNSQTDSVAAALTHLGYDYPTTVSVVGLADGSPADGIIEAGDQVVSVNGVSVRDITELRLALQDNGTADAATVAIVRDGEAENVQVTPIEVDGAVIVGISVTTEYDFPFDVKIQLDRVGGPSAGMMFALGIIDKLTPGALQGGENVAGTGTINQAGEVGPIGGIQQKLYGADEAGAEWFLAPADNCDEVTGHIPDGLTVFAVDTLDEAVTALEALAAGGDTSALPSCPAA